MEDQYELDEGISLGTIFKVGFGRKLLFLIVTLCVAVVAFLAIVLIYNREKEVYESTFTYNMVTTTYNVVTTEDGKKAESTKSGGKYIDGFPLKDEMNV